MINMCISSQCTLIYTFVDWSTLLLCLQNHDDDSQNQSLPKQWENRIIKNEWEMSDLSSSEFIIIKWVSFTKMARYIFDGK